MAVEKSNKLFDYLGSFPEGMDSGIDPLLLSKGQLAFNRNGTVRGNFLCQRPPYSIINLSYADAPTQTNFQTGLFQGAGYYKPDIGPESIMLSVAGRLFQVIPDTGGGATVADKSIPGDINPSNLTQDWMFQAENYWIVNDGVSIPEIFDNTNTWRTNNGVQTILGTVDVPGFAVPAQGSDVSVPLTAPFTGTIGQAVLIGNATYVSVSHSATYYQANLTNIDDSSAATYPAGTPIVQNPNALFYAGNTSFLTYGSASSSGAAIGAAELHISCDLSQTVLFTVGGGQSFFTYWNSSGSALPIGSETQITIGSDYTGSVGDKFVWGGIAWHVTGFVDGNGTSHGTVGTGWPTLSNPKIAFVSESAQPNHWVQFVSVGQKFIKSSAIGNYTGAFGGVGVGARFTWGSIVWRIIGCMDGDGTLHGTFTKPSASSAPTSGNLYGYDSSSFPMVACVNESTLPAGWTQTISEGQGFYALNSNLPTVTVGILTLTMTVPQEGSVVTASLVGEYVGADNLAVEINGYLYTIINIPPTPPGGNSVWLENINDTPDSIAVPHVITAGTVIYPLPQLPTGRMGAYGRGRIWLSLPDGISFLAGDIVGGSSGTPAKSYRDAVLNISENTYLAGGGVFRVPGSTGDIKAMCFVSLLDVSLGQGPLQIFTTLNIFGCQAPVDRSTWQSLTNPILTESLKGSGGISQDAVSPSSGDLLFRSPDGNLRSLLMARLDFNKWGNTPISQEMQRVLDTEDKTLLSYDSSVVFDNRELLAAVPVQGLRGVYYTSILALNFDPISSLRGKDNSIWDGEWTGLNVLKLVSGFFNGVERCFAVCLSTDLTQIELHEILSSDSDVFYDDGTVPISSYSESPMIFGPAVNKAHDYLKLAYGEIAVDGIVGPVTFQTFYKPDQWPNWVPWHSWTQTYTPTTDPGFRPRVGLPKPKGAVYDVVNNRPLREGFNFQFKLVGTGPFRFLGARFSAEIIPQPEFAKPIP